jgi:alpha-L-fucosidase
MLRRIWFSRMKVGYLREKGECVMGTSKVSAARGKPLRLAVLGLALCLATLSGTPSVCAEDGPYKPTWNSLRKHEVPDWLRDGKFGIFTHWGIYSVHAYGTRTTWYGCRMYASPESDAREHFEKTFGKLTPEFGYKDLIPMFTGENFDADEWAELFKKAGAKFAGPVAEHHDGFAMWDTKYSDWNAAKMGPRRDVVGELEKAIKKRDMKFLTTFQNAANWYFFPVWDDTYDTGDPRYSGLYGQPHKQGAMCNQAFIDEWQGKIYEVIDTYSPDYIFLGHALNTIPEGYVQDVLAYYYNHAVKNNKEVLVTSEHLNIIPGAGISFQATKQEPGLTRHEWVAASTVDDRNAWGYANDLTFKTPDQVIHELVDRVSKNGYLLLNVGPKADGTIPAGARDLLLDVGAWLDVNGEAIYRTTPWFTHGEGPTNLGREYTGEDIRFTVKGDTLYATFLDWPGEKATIRALRGIGLEADQGGTPVDEALSLVGKTYTLDGTTWVLQDDGKAIARGGMAGDGLSAYYEQEGTNVFISMASILLEGAYDGETLTITDHLPAFHRQAIKRITMLGDGKDLDWKLTRRGLVIDTPEKKPCEHAFVFKIERYHRPRIE